eukprot:jgi/Ulvmu1/8619/UM046_0019.1
MSDQATNSEKDAVDSLCDIRYRQYKGEQDIKLVKQIVDPELSEPYSIFTYRLFLSPWPQLCHFCYVNDKPAGVVVCKIDDRPKGFKRGYLGMIVVLKEYRKLGIGSELAKRAIQSMIEEHVDEVTLECEAHNRAALALYQHLGFLKAKRLRRYYLTGSDAIRLKLHLKPMPDMTDSEDQLDMQDAVDAQHGAEGQHGGGHGGDHDHGHTHEHGDGCGDGVHA